MESGKSHNERQLEFGSFFFLLDRCFVDQSWKGVECTSNKLESTHLRELLIQHLLKIAHLKQTIPVPHVQLEFLQGLQINVNIGHKCDD